MIVFLLKIIGKSGDISLHPTLYLTISTIARLTKMRIFPF
jgi:hypothetical protein